MKNIKFFDETKNILNKFGPEILSGLAVIFTGLAIKSAMDKAEDAVEVKERYNEEIKNFNEMTESSADQEAAKKTLKTMKLQKNIELALVYKWSFIFGFSSAVCMVSSTKLSGSKLAAAYALAKLNEDKLKIALEKSKELFGEDAKEKLENKIAEGMMVKSTAPFAGDDDICAEDELLFEDGNTGIPIRTTMANIDRAKKDATDILKKNYKLSYKKWLTILGVPKEYVNNVGINTGWNVLHPFDFELSEFQMGDVSAYLIKYKNEPIANFYHMSK